ncbi:ATP-binding protein [Bradyrhizobium sp. LHD-71]|uniref:ATP-binding protein n=1 Tax=Bradyrhizobium sp. LHD-71 TaxID=3072141 RepID=UPI0028106A76|nr:ATP-binding protein [Bradyrhizobium sp. LHD-71]MDQ8727344.1 ATP-binding protein [Bradyrhizobium sp. LHD-71]
MIRRFGGGIVSLGRSAGGLRELAPTQHALIGGVFMGTYLGLEWLTRVHELQALGITLWNPAKALSLGLLLLKGIAYAPMLFLAALLVDLFIYGAAKSVTSTVATSMAVALGYAVLAAGLKRGLGVALGRSDLRNVIAVLVTVPAGTFVIACVYCGLLILFGDMPAERYWEAVRHLWVGDTVGIIILLPVAMAVFGSVQRLLDTKSTALVIDSMVFLAGVLIALWLIFSIEGAHEYHFFYLLFLPVSWIAMRAGFAGAAIGVSVAHLLLVAFINWGGYPASTFMGYQFLVLALALNGLLLGAVVDERRSSDELLREQHAEVVRVTRHATAGAMGVSLAHQISQPLSNVAMYLHVGRQLLADRPAEPVPIAELLEKAAGQLRHAKDILERLRDFVSRGALRPARTDLGALARKVVALAEDDARTHGVLVRFEAAPVPPVTVDALQLEQALINVINNAVDAAAEARRLPGCVNVRMAAVDKGVRIEIEDNGPGVSDVVAKNLFEPFITTKPSGMGLGLALSRELISAHGGTIDWERMRPDGGARFTIELPLSSEVGYGA